MAHTLPLLPACAPTGLLQHPEANRRVLLAGAVEVAYRLQRARRRSIGLIVGHSGLEVRAPRSATLATVDAALQEKSPWILRKLGEMHERQRQQADAYIVWQDGATVPYLGTALVLRLVPDLEEASALRPGDTGPQLHLRLARSAGVQQLRDAVQAWFMRQALAHFQARLQHFAPLVGVQWGRLRLSNARTRWGSARLDGTIALNWRLLHYRPALIDYVVVHELSHLRVMNHSPSFWDAVGQVLPDYTALRQQLRAHSVPAWHPVAPPPSPPPSTRP